MSRISHILSVKLTALTAEFESGMQKSERKLGELEKKIQNTTKTLKTFAGALGIGLGVSALTSFTRNLVAAGSAITDMAEATNVGIKQIQVLNYLATEAGATHEQMAQALVRVQRAAVDATRGLKTQQLAFANLNIDVNQFIKLAPEKMIEAVGKALAASRGDINAYTAALDLLGARNAPKLMEALRRLGVEGFDEVSKAAVATGQVMREDVAKALDNISDSTVKVKTALRNFSSELLYDAVTTYSKVVGLWKDILRPFEGPKAPAKPTAPTPPPAAPFVADPNVANDFLANMPTITAGLKSVTAGMDAASIATTNLQSSIKQMTFDGFANVVPAIEVTTEAVEEFSEVVNRAPTLMDEAAAGVQNFAYAIETALVNASSHGKTAFADLGRFILAEIQRILIRVTILRPLFSAIGGMVGGDSNALGTAFLSSFGGGKASGGAVAARTSYVVGERGPELFTPNASGVITPNNALGAGATINIDARGADAAAVARIQNALGQLNASVESRSIAAVGRAFGRSPGFLRG